MHNPDDVDDSEDSFHHTLGTHKGQAMPGFILSSFTITGSRPADPFLRQVLNALVILGATDATT